MTVLEIIQRSTSFLEEKGVESPRLQIELMLAHLLKIPRLNLYLEFERPLGPKELEQLRPMVQRRAAREPLQQILGSTSFCGLEITVNRHVLVPRPETELLAEQAWEHLKALNREQVPEPKALDFGTGSGCLAIALAHHCPACRVEAVDVSAEAIDVATRNAAAHGLTDRITFAVADGLAALSGKGPFDVVVSNPPYIPSEQIATLEPEVREFEPRQALDGGVTGLDCYRRLARELRPVLAPHSRVFLELGDDVVEGARALFSEGAWSVVAIHNDLNGKPRILIACARV